MASTIKELAEALNLSASTVSRVLSGRYEHLYAEETRQRVRRAAKERQFSPNPVARALVTGKTDTVGVISYALYPTVYTHMLIEINAILYDNRRHVQVYESLNRVPDGSELRRLCAWPVDGVLAFDSPETALALKRAGLAVPLVCLGTAVPDMREDDGIDRVWVDAYPAVLDALWDMARQPGVRRLALLGEHAPDDPDCRDVRVRAYREVIREFGLAPEYIPVSGWEDPRQPVSEQHTHLHRRKRFAREAVVRHVRERGRPDAIFAATDDLAMGVLRGLRDLGLSVPRDLLLMGFDGIEEAEYLYVDLTTVALPGKRLCETAWQLLQRRLAEPGAPVRRVTLPAEARLLASSRRGI